MEPINLRSGGTPRESELAPRPLDKARDKQARGIWHRLTGEPMRPWEKILGVVGILAFLFVFYVVLDANKYRATVRVIAGEGRVGVNPTTELLDFGDLSPGTAAIRRVSIENRTWVPMYVAVIRYGAINQLMELDKNNFVVPAGASDKIEFRTYMPASASEGQVLEGRVYLFKIPGPWSN